MIISEILNVLGRLVDLLLSMIGLGNTSGAVTLDPNTLQVFIKYAGKSIQVDLDPSWTISEVKEAIAPKLGCSPTEMKIIFAGNELPDGFIIQTCDVGQHSFLHAVKVQVDSTNSNPLVKAFSQIEDDRIDDPPSSSLMLSNRTRTFSKAIDDEMEDISKSLERIASPTPVVDESVQDDEIPSVSGPSRSDFFVFCPECSDLKEGKLRVRCAKCLSGAFTVRRAPQGWSDVLEPVQVEGFCETEDCGGTFSQFYFKCTSHITKGEDDSAPPLPQIRRNSEAVPCLACGDVNDVIFLFPCPLSHVTCVDCLKDYLLVKLNQREFIQNESLGYTLGCPALCQDSLIKDPHHFKLLGKYQYDRYQRFGTEECLIQMGGLFCPQPDCGMGIIPADSNCDKIACLHGCGYVFCRKCLEGWHIGDCRQEGSQPSEDCSAGGYRSAGYFVSEDRAAAAQWGDPNRRALRLSTKPCPNCRVPTERDGGCMHMECTKCKFDWCWVCQTKWTRDCMGNHWFG